MDFLSQYAVLDLFWIGLSLFLIGMSKGGFPVGAIALPILILVWPTQAQAARAAVGFMLPMLCLMDIVALSFYWRKIQWGRLIYLMPATILGVAVAAPTEADAIDLERLEAALADQAFRLVDTVLRMGVTSRCRCYAPGAIVSRLEPILELVGTIEAARKLRNREEDR